MIIKYRSGVFQLACVAVITSHPATLDLLRTPPMALCARRKLADVLDECHWITTVALKAEARKIESGDVFRTDPEIVYITHY